MKLPIKVLLSYLGLGVGCLGTYAAVSVFDNKQIEDVVEDYEDDKEVMVVADSPKVSSEPSTTKVIAEAQETARSSPLVAPVAAPQISPVKTTAKRTRPKRSIKKRGARIQTIEKVGKGGPRAWEKFTELTKQFLGIR